MGIDSARADDYVEFRKKSTMISSEKDFMPVLTTQGDCNESR